MTRPRARPTDRGERIYLVARRHDATLLVWAATQSLSELAAQSPPRSNPDQIADRGGRAFRSMFDTCLNGSLLPSLAAAERGFDLAVAAGEVYTLGALARLYADAGVHLDRARALSERNWKVKRDGAARATWIALHDGAAPPAPPSSAPPR